MRGSQEDKSGDERTMSCRECSSLKAPSWLARMQAASQARRPGGGGGGGCVARQQCERDAFRPTHKRSESLATMKDFLIYNQDDEGTLERATTCDKTTTTTINKLINGRGGGGAFEGREDGAAAELRQAADIHYLLDDNECNDYNEEQRAATNDKTGQKRPRLKARLVRQLHSLSASARLLLLALLVLVSCALKPTSGALVINVGERAAEPLEAYDEHDAHHDRQHHHFRPRRAYVIVGDSLVASNGSYARMKRASSEAKEQRSAKLLEVDALNYLHRYGYMNDSNGGANTANLISENSFHEAIMQFQRFAGIPETGSVDSLTVRYMQMPRCGNKDMSGKNESGRRRRRKRRRRRRKKRYALQGSKWRRQELSYRISQYPTRFMSKKHEVDAQIERAFKIWSQVAPIDFVVKRDGRVHIDIRFASGEHGDGDPFDGPGNTLAHAYFPQYGGDAHFDDQEYWTVDSYAGTNIFQVAAHELGHSLGLGHSSVREALMAPFYQKFKPNFKLHADDVLAIQALYGERGANDGDDNAGSTTSTTSTTTEQSVPRRRPAADEPGSESGGGGSGSKPVDLCQDSKIDAITRTEDGNTYAFRGQHYWQIKNEGLASGSPGKISRDWDGLPGNLDAALTWSDGKTFFFKNDKYWRYFNKRREPGYPKLISVGFAGIPNNVQAAFVWGGNGKTYFFKGDKYWRFDSKQEPPVSGQYPKPAKNWAGLPAGGIDGAFKWENGMTYFFKDDLYYRFDDREFEVDSSARPAFPRSTAEWWLGCTNSNLPIRKAQSGGGSDDEALEPSESSATDSSSAPPSLLLFHRRPNLAYESARQAGGGGASISRSIISSLSALFPSSSSSSSSSTNRNLTSNSDEWSFHRGLGEEVRRLMQAGSQLSRRSGASESAATGANSAGGSRWSFPLGSSQSGGVGEQSLSELRMRADDDNDRPRATAASGKAEQEDEHRAKEGASVVTR